MNLRSEGIRRISTAHAWRCLAPELLNCWNEGLGWLAGGFCRVVVRRFGVDMGIGWAKEADRACAHLTADDTDVVLASGPPFTTFAVAEQLAHRLGRPYVLDYRDPWTNSPHYESRRSATLRKEARLITGSAAISIVSPSWASALDRRFHAGSKLHVVTNGFDPDDLEDVQPFAFGHFAIVYAGRFYPPKRIISPLLAALTTLDSAASSRQNDWRFHYYGPHEEHVREEAVRLRIIHRVLLHGMVPRSEALSALRGAGVAAVITSVLEESSLEDEGIVTGKLFETLGLGIPILLIAPPGSDARSVVKTAGAGKAFIGTDTVGIAAFLDDLMRQPSVAPTNVSAYAWPSIAKQLDAVLRTVCTKKS